MFGQTTLGSATLNDADNRMYRYEVAGLRQTYQSDKLGYPIRRSGSFFVTVPYSRMNEEMQRINRLGGRIVKIEPLTLESGITNDKYTGDDATTDSHGSSSDGESYAKDDAATD